MDSITPTQPTQDELQSVEYWRNKARENNEAFMRRTDEYMQAYEEAIALRADLAADRAARARYETLLRYLRDSAGHMMTEGKTITDLRGWIAMTADRISGALDSGGE